MRTHFFYLPGLRARSFLVILFCTVQFGLAISPGPTQGMTKAEFSKRMLNFLELELPQGVPSATESWETLQGLGFFSSGSPDSPLTEGDLSEVARKAGLDLRTENPENVVNPQKVQSFLSIFGPNLQKGLLRASTASLGQAHEVHLSPTAILRRDKRRRQPVSPADPNATARPASDPLP